MQVAAKLLLELDLALGLGAPLHQLVHWPQHLPHTRTRQVATLLSIRLKDLLGPVRRAKKEEKQRRGEQGEYLEHALPRVTQRSVG